MTDAIESIKSLSTRAATFLLVAFGLVLLIGAAFCFFLAFSEPQGRHGDGGLFSMSLLGLFQVVIGVGFLVPRPLPKLLSSLLLLSGGVWIFSRDAFRRENWWIYCLLVVPLLLALWIRKGNSNLAFRRLRNVN